LDSRCVKVEGLQATDGVTTSLVRCRVRDKDGSDGAIDSTRRGGFLRYTRPVGVVEIVLLNPVKRISQHLLRLSVNDEGLSCGDVGLERSVVQFAFTDCFSLSVDIGDCFQTKPFSVGELGFTPHKVEVKSFGGNRHFRLLAG